MRLDREPRFGDVFEYSYREATTACWRVMVLAQRSDSFYTVLCVHDDKHPREVNGLATYTDIDLREAEWLR